MPQHPRSFASILGTTFVNASSRPILKIGSKAWNRYDLARLGVPHLHAARHLDGVVQQLRIRTLTDLRDQTDAIAGLAGTGPTTLYVVLAILNDAGIPPARAYHATVTVAGLKARQRRKELNGRPRVRSSSASSRHSISRRKHEGVPVTTH